MTAALRFDIRDDELADLDRGLDWAVVLPIIAARRVEALRGLIAHRRIAGTFTGASAMAAIEAAATLIGFIAATEKSTSPRTLRRMRQFATTAGCDPGRDLDAMLARVLEGAAYVSARDAGLAVELNEDEWAGWHVSFIYPIVSEQRLEALLAERERARLKARDAERNQRRRKQNRESYEGGSVSQLARELGVHHMVLRRQMAKAGVTTAAGWRKHLTATARETTPLLDEQYRRDQLSHLPQSAPALQLKTKSALSADRRRASVTRLLTTAVAAFSPSPARSAPPSRGAR